MSAIWTVQEAIVAAIEADVALSAKLKGEKVYSLLAPETDDTLPYILLSQSAENREPLFDRRMQRGNETGSVWSSDLTKFECADICADLVRILDSTRLSLDGYTFVTGAFAILAIALDPSGKYSRANWSYEVLSIA